MQLEPIRVDAKDIKRWIFQSFDLINRRWLAYLLFVGFFFSTLYASTLALNTVKDVGPPIVLLLLFLVVSAFLFYFSIAGLVMISHSSDHSRKISLATIVQTFLPSQKIFLKMSVIAIGFGLFYWYISILMNPGSSIAASSESIVNILGQDETLLFYLFKTAAVFSYFLLLVLFTLRIFFSVPLILFHDLNYQEAQALSQKAIFLNMKVMMQVLLIWIMAFLVTMKITPVLSLLLIPLFAGFVYVAYRQIFLQVGDNQKAFATKPVTEFSRIPTT